MKILICAFACIKDPDERLNSGGEGFLGWNVIKQISRLNQVWALTNGGNKEKIEEALSNCPLPNVNFCYVFMPSYLKLLQKVFGGVQFYAYLWQIKAYFLAKKLHKEINFDIFHHLTYANDWMASFIGALLPVPYIRGPGGGAQKVPKNFLSELSIKDRFAEYFRSSSQRILRHDPFFIIGRKKARAILVCNKESMEIIPEKYRRKTRLFSASGISKDDLDLLDMKNATAHEFQVLSAGNMVPIKGFALAIKAFKVFNDKYPESELIIIGGGMELPNLKKLVRNLDVERKVLFKEWMSRKNLLHQMLSSDVFLFASLRDGSPGVIIESMAAGKPVVCLDVAGPGFFIEDKCGIKVAPSFPEQAADDMAKALEKLYLDKNLRDKLGRAAREKAENFYSWDKLGEQLLEIYKNIVEPL